MEWRQVMKKTSIVLVITLIWYMLSAGFINSSSGVGENFNHYNENFDVFNKGSIVGQDGWVSENSGDGTILAEEGRGRVLKISGATSGFQGVRKAIPRIELENKYMIVEFDLKIEKAATKGSQFFRIKEGGRVIFRLVTDSNLRVQVNWTGSRTVGLGIWNRIKVIVDLTPGSGALAKTTAYLNGLLIAEDTQTDGLVESGPNNFDFVLNDCDGEIMIDNIQVYKGTWKVSDDNYYSDNFDAFEETSIVGQHSWVAFNGGGIVQQETGKGKVLRIVKPSSGTGGVKKEIPLIQPAQQYMTLECDFKIQSYNPFETEFDDFIQIINSDSEAISTINFTPSEGAVKVNEGGVGLINSDEWNRIKIIVDLTQGSNGKALTSAYLNGQTILENRINSGHSTILKGVSGILFAANSTNNSQILIDNIAVNTASEKIIGYASDNGDFLPGVGAGSAIYKVTNLNNSGTGSLRDALSQNDRLIVFEVGGIINLTTDLIIRNKNNITIAGETAPAPGISIHGRMMVIDKSSNILMRHIRIRTGTGTIQNDPIEFPGSNADALGVLGTDQNIQPIYENIWIDHCSFAYAMDETLSLWFSGYSNVTLSNNIITDPLQNTGLHDKNPASHGFHVLIGGGVWQNVDLQRNLISNGMMRNPRVTEGFQGVIMNNIINNWGNTAIEIGTEDKTNRQWLQNPPTRITIGGNIGISGPDTTNFPLLTFLGDNAPTDDAKFYYNNNTVWNSATLGPRFTAGANPQKWVNAQRSIPPMWIDGMLIMSAMKLDTEILMNSGARPKERRNLDLPDNMRDKIDVRAIEQLKNRTGKHLDNDTQPEAGGYPILASSNRALNPPSIEDVNAIRAWLKGYLNEVQYNVKTCNEKDFTVKTVNIANGRVANVELVKNTSVITPAVLIVAIYQSGRLSNVVFKILDEALENSITAIVDIDTIIPDAGESIVKAFVWDNLNDMTALSNVMEN